MSTAKWPRLDLKSPVFLTMLVVLASLVLYTMTLAPGLLWGGGDFARLQTLAYTGDFSSDPTGHPLWIMVVHPFTWLPLGDVAYRANLTSAIFSALALGLVFLIIRDLTESATGAGLGTLALMLSHTFWTYAVMPKVYALNSLLLASCLYLVLRWGRRGETKALYAFAGLYGLSAMNHLLMLTAAPGFLVYLILKRRHLTSRQMLITAGLYGLGLAPYVILTLVQATSGQVTGTIVAFPQRLILLLLSPRGLILGLGVFLACLGYQFFVTLGAGLLGLLRLVRLDRPVFWMLALIYVGDVAFVFAWIPSTPTLSAYVQNWHFYLPSYLVFAIWAGVGFADLVRSKVRSRRWRFGLLVAVVIPPLLVYSLLPMIAREPLRRLSLRDLPGRDNATYLMSPWKQHETGARVYGEQILSELPANSVILADYSIYWILAYLQTVEARRPDVQIVKIPPLGHGRQVSAITRYIQAHPVYIPDTNRYYEMADIESRFRVVQEGAVYHLLPR
ncbi:MAG: DUF2723 domain-containing protein [Anaerolineae bacterium]